MLKETAHGIPSWVDSIPVDFSLLVTPPWVSAREGWAASFQGGILAGQAPEPRKTSASERPRHSSASSHPWKSRAFPRCSDHWTSLSCGASRL